MNHEYDSCVFEDNIAHLLQKEVIHVSILSLPLLHLGWDGKKSPKINSKKNMYRLRLLVTYLLVEEDNEEEGEEDEGPTGSSEFK